MRYLKGILAAAALKFLALSLLAGCQTTIGGPSEAKIAVAQVRDADRGKASVKTTMDGVEIVSAWSFLLDQPIRVRAQRDLSMDAIDFYGTGMSEGLPESTYVVHQCLLPRI